MKLGKFVRVENFEGMANQFIIYFENGTILQSYNSIIVVKLHDDDIIYLGRDWNYSNTTSKYRNAFLGMDKNDILRAIKDGFIVVDENLR